MSLSILAPIGVIGPALRRAAAVADPRSATPILGCVLLSAGGDGILTITASRGSLALVQRVPMGAAIEDTGTIAVDAARLSTVVGGLSGDSVLLRVGGKTGKCGLDVRAGGSRYSLSAAEAADYPPQGGDADGGAVDATTIKGGDLARMLGETMFSMCMEENRYGINGLLIEAPDDVDAGGGDAPRLRIVSTDGSRLSWSEGPASAAVTLGERKRLISRAFVAELRKLIGGDDQEWTLTIGARWISARCGEVELSGVLVEGEFPDYRMVLPRGGPKRVATVAGPALVSALKRASLMASDRNSSVRLDFGEGGLTIRAQDVKAGSVVEELACELVGAPLSTGFNARYLLEVLGAARADSVRIELGEALDPVILRVDGRADAVFVVMPIRLD